MNPTRPVLDPKVITEIVDAIVALDWTSDMVADPLRIIQDQLGLAESPAVTLFLRLQEQNLIACKPGRPANNVEETGGFSPLMTGKWIKPEAL